MKSIKFLAAALAIVAILATIAWLLRNTIIQRISNPLLAEYGLEIINVSLDAIAPRNASIAYLKLRHENGTIISIDRLTLPIGTRPGAIRSFRAERVTVDMPDAGDTAAPQFARSIDLLLQLPEALPNTELFVAELGVTAYPLLRGLQWASTGSRQTLRAGINGIAFSTEIVRADPGRFALMVSAGDDSSVTARQSMTAEIRRTDPIISIVGESSLDLRAWNSLAASFGLSAPGLENIYGAAELHFDLEIPYDTDRVATLDARLAPSMPFDISYADTTAALRSVNLKSAGVFQITATYPTIEWSIEQPQASLLVTYGQWQAIPIGISKLACRTGPTCSVSIEIALDNADLTIARSSRLQFSATQDIEFRDEDLRVLLRPKAELALRGVSGPDIEFSGLTARLESGATLTVSEAGWQFSADSIDGRIDSLSLDDDLAYTSPISLRKLIVGESEKPLTVKALADAPAGKLMWDKLVIDVPGFKGDFSLSGAELALAFSSVGLHREAKISARHSLDTGTGQLSIKDAAISFRSRALSHRVSPWQFDWDISAGTVSGDLQLNWKKPGPEWDLYAQSSIQIEKLAGIYGDIALTGLTSKLTMDYRGATGFAVAPGDIAIGLIDVGLPIENISADYRLHPNDLSVDIDKLRMAAFGGIVQADPFNYQLGRERNSLLLRADSIDLTELLTLKEFEAIELVGSVSAELPVIIEGTDVSIVDGRLTGVAPGVIRYLPAIVPESTGVSSIGFVTRALSNFQYDTLSSNVDYGKTGDLKLQVRLAGRNPDLKDNRPIVLNLGVENNVPQMLRSLQAARAVEDVLEKRLAR